MTTIRQTPPGDIARQQLAAVKVLLSRERIATEHDILIATCLEALKEGPKAMGDLLRVVEQTWHGAGVDEARLGQALRTAEVAGFVVQTVFIDETHWLLSTLGSNELSNAPDWARETWQRTRIQMAAEAERSFREITDEEGELWVGILTKALCRGICAAFFSHEDVVDAVAEHTLFPKSYDVELMLEVVREQAREEDVVEFLQARVIAAMDPADSFASDLVTHISTGYILHAYVARRDRPAARRLLGSLRDERAILDTPLLFSLVDSGQVGDAIRNAIRAAIRAGNEVVVAEHSLEEFYAVLERVEREDLPVVQSALLEGLAAGDLAAVVDDDLIAMWLRGRGRGGAESWGEFRHTCERLPKLLETLGLQVRQHGNDREADRVELCRAALQASLDARGGGRGEEAVERDSHTMAMAWRRRRRTRHSTGYAGRFWPGAMVVTTDTYMNAAYTSVDYEDQVPLAITPSQWFGLVTACADAADVEALASSATTLMAVESMLRVASGFPAPVAVEIATALGPGAGGSDTDLRTAMTMSEAFASQPDLIQGDAGALIAAEVTARRNRRMKKGYESQLRRVQTDHSEELRREKRELAMAADRHREREAELSTALKVERADHAGTRAEIAEIRAQLDSLQEQHREAEERSRRRERLRPRARLMLGVCMFACAVAAALLAVGAFWAGGAMAVSAAIFWAASHDWRTKEEAPVGAVLLGVLPQIVPLGQLLASLR